MRKAFSDARAKAPAVLFIDETDSFPNRATLKHDWADYEIQIVNALLTEIDGVGGREGVILIGACNFPQKLDPALIRSGRLDRHIVIGPPDRAGLARILREHLGSDLTGADLTGAAMAAAGSTGADCEKLVRGARRRARLENRDIVMEDRMSEIGVPPLDPAEVRATAVHEAGHAVTLCSYQPGVLETVALRDAGDSSGRTVGRYTPPLEGTALEGDRFLQLLLSGRAAEEEILGNATGGGGVDSDLGRATHFAVHAYAAHGMDPAGDLVWSGEPSRHAVADVLAGDRAMSDRVQARLEEAYAAARAFVRENLNVVIAVAKLIAQKRVVDALEVEAVIAGSAHQSGS